MVERFIERSKQKLVRWNEQQEVSAGSNNFPRGHEKRFVVLDVLENVHRDERIGCGRQVYLVDVRPYRAHAIASDKLAFESGKNVSRGLDAQQALHTGRID